jgi:hypothetical protein
MREVSLVSNQNECRLYVVTLVSDGAVSVSYDDANAVSWTRLSTGITSGARSGLDAAVDQRSDAACLFFSYFDTSDTLRIHGGFAQPLSLPAGNGTTTSISAYLDTVICAYEDATSSPHRVRYLLSYDGGETGIVGLLGDSGVAADAPAVTVSGGNFAAVYRSSTSATELLFCQRTDSGPWSDPNSIAEHEPYWNRPGIEYLGGGVFGVVYLSNTSPVVRGAYFDRSDWVYGIAEQRQQPQASSHKPQATVVRGVLFLPSLGTRSELSERNSVMSRAALLDISGRKVLDLKPGANDVRTLAPGVYFVHSAIDNRQSKMIKVVITR